MELFVLFVRALCSGVVWLLVSKWRATFPVHVLLAMGLGSFVINNMIGDQDFTQDATAVIMVALICVVILALVRTSAPRRENRLFGYVSAGAGGAWVLATRFAPLTTSQLALAALVLLLIFAVVWSMDYRQAAVVKLDDEVKSFTQNPERQKRANVSELEFAERNEEAGIGWTGVLVWPGNANSTSSVIANTRALETEWGEQEGSVSIERIFDQQTHRAYSNKVFVTCVRVNPLVTSVKWDAQPVPRLDAWVQLGVYDDGKPIWYRLWEPGIGGVHMLVAGAPGAGKSHLLRLLGLAYGPHPFIRPIFMDFKGGTAFRPQAAMGCWLITELISAVAMLELLYMELERRVHYVAKMGWKNGVWIPSERDPIILCLFDEIAAVTGKGAGMDPKQRTRIKFMISQIAQKGRTAGIILIAGTQEPTTESLGTTQFINMFGMRIAFRLNVKGRAQYCIPNLAGEVEPASIPVELRGACYVDFSGPGARSRQARMREIPEWANDKIVGEFWHDSLENQVRQIDSFVDPTPSAATMTEETFVSVQNVYLNRERHTLGLPSSQYEPGSSQLPEVPRPSFEKPQRPAMPPREREMIDRAVHDDDTTEIGPTGQDHRKAKDLVIEADGLPENSKEGSRLRKEAVALMLVEFPGGLQRKTISDFVKRKGSWTSARLVELENEGRAHRVGPPEGGALWYPGPARPDEDDLDDDEDDDDQED